MSLIRCLASFYTPKLPFYYVYMLQQVEYQPRKYFDWLVRIVKNRHTIQSVMHRQQLVMTKRAQLLVIFSYASFFALLAVAAISVQMTLQLVVVVAAAAVFYPDIVFLLLLVTSYVARVFVVAPQNQRMMTETNKIFSNIKATKIAVIGSYGKTTLKEALNTVLSEGKRVAATPGNMNVVSSHYKFAKSLSGKEEVVIVEFGEGAPGDVARMSKTIAPDIAVIVGLAPNHLDQYASLADVADDLLSVSTMAPSSRVYANNESVMLRQFIPDDIETFDASSALGWKISDVKVSVQKSTFKMTKGKKTLHIDTQLIGRQLIPVLAFAAAIADSLGLSKQEIEAGVAKTTPFNHRMQPRNVHGAWIIDDTYNGNLEGMQAGLALLHELEAKRKWYVTPGLVDQGVESSRVHYELGKAIAEAQPDIVVLMNNSVTEIIKRSMVEHQFAGELRVEDDPLEFYTNIEHTIAAGDLLLMQNDWTDNYN